MIRLLALMAVLTLGACATTPPSGPRPPTILISIDGFRPDYLDRGVTPVLSGLAADGAPSQRPQCARSADLLPSGPRLEHHDPRLQAKEAGFGKPRLRSGQPGHGGGLHSARTRLPPWRQTADIRQCGCLSASGATGRRARQAGRWAACADTASTRHLIRYLHYALNIAETHKETRCG